MCDDRNGELDPLLKCEHSKSQRTTTNSIVECILRIGIEGLEHSVFRRFIYYF